MGLRPLFGRRLPCVAADQMEFYYSSTAAWQALSLACTRAERSIDFEEYIVRDDRIGTTLLHILMPRHARACVFACCSMLLAAVACTSIR